MTRRDTIPQMVARRLLSEMEDHGGVEDFCEKLQAFPEQYALDLATAALDHLRMCGWSDSSAVIAERERCERIVEGCGDMCPHCLAEIRGEEYEDFEVSGATS